MRHGGVLFTFNLWQDWRVAFFSKAIFRLWAWDSLSANPNAIWYWASIQFGFIVQKTQKIMILKACLSKMVARACWYSS
jgi:hypothetical protein